MLAKGPIALALPLLIILLFLIWEKQTSRLLSINLLGALFLFLLVSGPWYIWVGVETKFQWHRGFFFTHNLGRFSTAMENHSGPWFYYWCLPWALLHGRHLSA
jgi:4-amino-4-deoxy-L-arabinose transferase-like glycosyltransferase